jgi:hypothetical protein
LTSTQELEHFAQSMVGLYTLLSIRPKTKSLKPAHAMTAAVALTEMTALCVQVVETPWRILNFKVVWASMPNRYDLGPPCKWLHVNPQL